MLERRGFPSPRITNIGVLPNCLKTRMARCPFLIVKHGIISEITAIWRTWTTSIMATGRTYNSPLLGPVQLRERRPIRYQYASAGTVLTANNAGCFTDSSSDIETSSTRHGTGLSHGTELSHGTDLRHGSSPRTTRLKVSGSWEQTCRVVLGFYGGVKLSVVAGTREVVCSTSWAREYPFIDPYPRPNCHRSAHRAPAELTRRS